MKKKNWLTLILAGAMILGLSACGSEGGTSSGGSAAGSSAGSGETERTTFTVGFDAEYPPYGFKAEDGSYVGFDLDLAQEVCDRNGWELVRQPIDRAGRRLHLGRALCQ